MLLLSLINNKTDTINSNIFHYQKYSIPFSLSEHYFLKSIFVIKSDHFEIVLWEIVNFWCRKHHICFLSNPAARFLFLFHLTHSLRIILSAVLHSVALVLMYATEANVKLRASNIFTWFWLPARLLYFCTLLLLTWFPTWKVFLLSFILISLPHTFKKN